MAKKTALQLAFALLKEIQDQHASQMRVQDIYAEFMELDKQVADNTDTSEDE